MCDLVGWVGDNPTHNHLPSIMKGEGHHEEYICRCREREEDTNEKMDRQYQGGHERISTMTENMSDDRSVWYMMAKAAPPPPRLKGGGL